MPHLHVGVKVADLLMFNKTIIGAGFSAPIVDGDGWPVWGEKPGSESNPPDVVHVIMKVRGTIGAEKIMKVLPPTVPLPNGTVALLTTSADWTEVISIYPEPLSPAKKEISDALEELYQGAVGLASEYSGPSVQTMIDRADNARAILRDALNL